MAGGKNKEYSLKATYFFEFSFGVWIWVADMNQQRSGHVCGTVSNENGEIFLVAAGGEMLVSVEIFSMITQLWKSGPALPHVMENAFGFFKTLNRFVIAGGLHFGRCPIEASECISSKYLYELENNFDKWVMMKPKSMKVSRGNYVGISLPRKMFPNLCQDDCVNCTGSKTIGSKSKLLLMQCLWLMDGLG